MYKNIARFLTESRSKYSVQCTRRSVVVNDRGAFYSRRRGRDSNTGGSRDRYHSSYSGIIFNGNFHRLQTPKEERFEEKEAEIEDATVISNEEQPKGGREIFSGRYVPNRCQ